ncbi:MULTISPECIES: hypothetical protein [Burkholderia]|nr:MULTISPECIES: hypothetical protein [Burkholderia]
MADQINAPRRFVRTTAVGIGAMEPSLTVLVANAVIGVARM